MNFNSAEWKEVAERLAKEIELAKESLCSSMEERRTLELRGGIRALRAILNWPAIAAAEQTEEPIEFS